MSYEATIVLIAGAVWILFALAVALCIEKADIYKGDSGSEEP